MPTREGKERLELLQGTLDLLILRTLIFGPQHRQGIAPIEVFLSDMVGSRSSAGFDLERAKQIEFVPEVVKEGRRAFKQLSQESRLVPGMASDL